MKSFRLLSVLCFSFIFHHKVESTLERYGCEDSKLSVANLDDISIEDCPNNDVDCPQFSSNPRPTIVWNYCMAPNDFEGKDAVCIVDIYTPSKNATGRYGMEEILGESTRQVGSKKKGEVFIAKCTPPVLGEFTEGEKGYFIMSMCFDGYDGNNCAYLKRRMVISDDI